MLTKFLNTPRFARNLPQSHSFKTSTSPIVKNVKGLVARLWTTERIRIVKQWFLNALPITNSPIPGRKVEQSFKCLDKKSSFKKDGLSFHNSSFVVYDLETYTDSKTNLVTPYMLGYVIAKVVKDENSVTGFAHEISKISTPINSDQDLKAALLEMIELSALELESKEIHILAHNAMKFDLKIIINSLLTLAHGDIRMAVTSTIADSSINVYQLDLKFETTTFHFRDSYKLIPASVESMGKTYTTSMLGGESVNPFKMSLNHDAMNKYFNEGGVLTHSTSWSIQLGIAIPKEFHNSHTPFSYVKDYCLTDCVIVVNRLIRFSHKMSLINPLLSFKNILTISSTAMSMFMSKFNNSEESPIMEISMQNKLSKFFKSAYLGGRTEVFHSGMGFDKIYHFDVPGMYALCMKKALPIGNPIFISAIKNSFGTVEEFLKDLHSNNMIGFFTANVETPESLNLPVLPIKDGGKLVFPLGRFSGVWTSYELELAIRKGYKIGIVNGYIFITGNPLKEYSEYFTNLKNQASEANDRVSRMIAKLMLNSLYGKFASNYYDNACAIVSSQGLRTLETLYEVDSVTRMEGDTFIVGYSTKPKPGRASQVGAYVYDKAVLNYNLSQVDKSVNVALAAVITSHGRIMLYNLMEEIENRGGVLCYTDTDSVFAWLPEMPFNKPFGPFTWAGNVYENTFSKALFIAPKMYYVEDLNGTQTFKVKGVSTKNISWPYFDLLQIFLSKLPIKFEGQSYYRRAVSNKSFSGLKHLIDVSKIYNVFANAKRVWTITAEGHYKTHPIIIDKLLAKNVIRTARIRDNPINFNVLLSLMNKHEFKVIDSGLYNTDDYSIQAINGKNMLQATILNNPQGSSSYAEIFTSNFKALWSMILSNIMHNTKNNPSEENVLKIQFVCNSNIGCKTLMSMPVIEVLKGDSNNIQIVVLEKFNALLEEYDGLLIPESIRVKVLFKEPIELIAETNMPSLLIEACRVYSRIKEDGERLKGIIKRSEEQLKAFAEIDDSKDYNEMVKSYTQKNPAIAQFQSMVKQHIRVFLQDNMHKFGIESTLESSLLSREIDRYVDMIYRAFHKTMCENGTWTIHSLAERLIDSLDFNRHVQEDVKNAMELSINLLVKLVKRGMVTTLKPRVNEKGEKPLNKSFIFTACSGEVLNWMFINYLIGKIRFKPVSVSSNKNIPSDMVKTLNIQNRVPVGINIEYYEVLKSRVLMVNGRKEIALKHGIDINDFNALRRFYITVEQIEHLIKTLVTLMEHFNTKHFYMQWTYDFRGRLYPKMVNLSHMTHKFMRPLFTIDSFPLNLITSLEYLVKGVHSTHAENFFNKTFHNLKTLPVKDLGKLLRDKHELYEKMVNPQDPEKFDYEFVVSFLDLYTLFRKGEVIPSPMQIDAKCNVMQHMATIVGDDKIMRRVGISKMETHEDDFYTRIVILFKEAFKSEILIQRMGWTNINFSVEDLYNELFLRMRQSQLRNLVKKPAMTKAYAATFFTIMQRIKESIIKEGHPLNIEKVVFISKLLEKVLKRAISKEMEWLNRIRIIVKTMKGEKLSWTMSPLSDFTVEQRNMKKLLFEGSFKVGESRFHTTYKVLTNEVDKRKNSNSLAVNIIHSIDAIHLSLIIQNCNMAILPIHDCVLFPTTENVNILKSTVYTTFRKMHRNNATYRAIAKQLISQSKGVLLVCNTGFVRMRKGWVMDHEKESINQKF